MNVLERLFQNGEFKRMRDAARSQPRLLNVANHHLLDVLRDVEAAQTTERDTEVEVQEFFEPTREELFVNHADSTLGELFNATSNLERLSQEHQQPDNQTDAWFNQGERSGRERYRSLRATISERLSQLSATCATSDVPDAVAFSPRLTSLAERTQSVIQENGDFPGGHESIRDLCADIDQLATEIDSKIQEYNAETRRLERERREEPPVETDTTSDPVLVRRCSQAMGEISAQLDEIQRTDFWTEPSLQVDNNSAADLAATIQDTLRLVITDDVANIAAMREVSRVVNELSEVMQDQLREHQSRPPEFAVESDRNIAQKTVSVLQDGWRSRYRNIVLAGGLTLAALSVGTVGYMRSGTEEKDPQQQSAPEQPGVANQPATAQPGANQPGVTQPNTVQPGANRPGTPNVARTVGSAVFEKGTVQVQGDNFVFTLNPTVKAAQAWVGKPGENPVRLPLQIVNGKATCVIPVELKNEQWIGVKVDTFETATWSEGAFKKLELK